MVFSVRADDHGGKRRVHLSSDEFIRRLLLHVLPGGVKRIRHYGVLANGCKKTQLAQARRALHQPAPNPQATACAQAFMARVAKIDVLACPRCKAPLHVAQTLPGLKYLPAPGAHPLQPQPVGARAPP